jgi:hypothetical protein
MMNFDMREAGQPQRRVSQHPSGACRQAPPSEVGVEPVAELEPITSDPTVQATPADDTAIEEDAEQHIAAVSPVTLTANEHLPALLGRQRLPGNPSHPRSQVLAAFGDRGGQRVGILGQPSA